MQFKTRVSAIITSIQAYTEDFIQWRRLENILKCIMNRKAKLPLVADDIIVYVENAK